MKVIRATSMGYCMGVKRAVEKAESALAQYPEKTVYTFGPLIHNETALATLASRGLKVLHEDEIGKIDGKNSVVIIRAHGTTPVLRSELEATGAVVIDATCPRVLSSQKRARDFARRGCRVIIAGDANHGEVAGIQGVVVSERGECIVLENEAQAQLLGCATVGDAAGGECASTGECVSEGECASTVVLSQTTFSPSEYEKIVNVLKSKISNISILNTICSATEERQNALHELCKEADIIFVVGGKISANTLRLFNIADVHSNDENFRVKKAYHVADFDEFIEIFNSIKQMIKNDDVIGITAGASTPEESINQIIDCLSVTNM